MRTALEASREEAIKLREDPSALAPECLLVFELKSPLPTFAAAVATISGLEFVAEEDEELTQDDEGARRYYAVFGDQAALNQMLSLWDTWTKGRPLNDDFKDWERVFACLDDLRRWGAKDRVSKTHAEAFKQLADDLGQNEEIHVEIELVFRSQDRADELRKSLRDRLSAAGATEVAAARHEGFGYDALLVSISRAAAIELASRADKGLASFNEAFRIRPQSIGFGDPSNSENATAPEMGPLATSTGQPVVAIFDAVPVQNHPLLADRITLSDPNNLEALAAGPRRHGTAIASLVIHGDLLAKGEPIRRPVYFCPIMADATNIPEMPNEQTLSNRLLVDDVVLAVQRMKEGVGGEPPEAPDVTVINISFGLPDLVFDQTVSPLARCLDWLSWRYGVLFVVSAGNCSEPLVINSFSNEAGFTSADPAARTEATLAALRDAKPRQLLLSPAEGVNVLSVGALHHDSIKANHTLGSSYDPLPQGTFPSIISRLGLGFARAIKPDILAPGGRLRVHLRPGQSVPTYNRSILPSSIGGLQVAGLIDPINGAQYAWSGCTSGAAAMTTHGLHLINDALEDAYGETFTNLPNVQRALLLKALLIHGARWPSEDSERIERIFSLGEKRHANETRADIARLFGFGMMDQDASRSCVFNRATGWGVGSLSKDQGQIFRLPLPEGLIGQRVPKALTATACWFTPITPGRQTYRAVKLRIDEKEDIFSKVLRLLGAKDVSKQQHTSHQTWRGTVLHRRYEGKSLSKFQDGEALEIKVSRMSDAYDEAVPEVPFALVASLEAEGDIPIFDQVLSKIDIGLRPRIPQPVVVEPR